MPAANPAIVGQVYCLQVASDIAFPELADASPGETADIVIRQGEVEQGLPGDPDDMSTFVRAIDEGIWLDLPGKLLMRIEAGRTITYQPYDGADPDEVRLYLLGSGLGALMMQRGHVVLHANAVAMPEGGALLCLGDSGVGKSTTATALMQRGHQVLADDVCPIGDDGLLRPGLARIRLWDDAAGRLAIDTSPLDRVRASDPKYNLPLCDHLGTQPRCPALFVVLETTEDESVNVTELKGFERFAALRKNVYRPHYLEAMGMEPAYLKRLAELASGTAMYRLSRPVRGFHVDRVVDAILALYEEIPARRETA